MLVGYDEAVRVFESLETPCKAPSLHPYYVTADARRDTRVKPCFFVYEDEHVFFHGFHLARVEGTDYFDIQSAYGYGGPVSTSVEAGFLTRAWQDYSQWCQDNDVLAEFVRFHPVLENWRYFKGQVFEDRETVWVDLKQENILMSYSTRARTAVRKAVKSGLKVEWVQDISLAEAFTQLYHGTMLEINAEEFYFFDQNYIREILEWERSHLAVCKYDNEVVAAAIFLVGPHMLEYHLSASNSHGRKLGATNLVLHEAALYGQKMGCSVLHLGGGTTGDSDNPLLFFKSGFSKLRTSFRIGKHIPLVNTYDKMKREWEVSKGKPANRVLFYRF